MRWTTHANQNSINGERNDAYTTAPSCQAYCASVPTCVAVDFNFDDNSCWLHNSANDLTDPNTFSQDNTNQYRIDRTCVTETATTSTTTTMSTTTAMITDSQSFTCLTLLFCTHDNYTITQSSIFICVRCRCVTREADVASRPKLSRSIRPRPRATLASFSQKLSGCPRGLVASHRNHIIHVTFFRDSKLLFAL